MRRSFRSEILKDSSNTIVGINLGADYCAEHEHGIQGLQRILGITPSDSVLGIESRRVTKIDMNRILLLDNPFLKEPNESKTGRRTRKNCTVLMIGDFHHSMSSVARLPDELRGYSAKGEKSKLSCAWNERSLGIYGETEEDRDTIRSIYKSLMEKDIAVWIGGGGVFQNAGLVLAVISKVSEESKKVMYDADADRVNLAQAAEATGIVPKLKEAGKGWLALNPSWSSSIKSTARGEMKTSFPVIFWLNPIDQRKNNYGWFTVEDLTDWINNTGPIPASNS